MPPATIPDCNRVALEDQLRRICVGSLFGRCNGEQCGLPHPSHSEALRLVRAASHLPCANGRQCVILDCPRWHPPPRLAELP
eukprot:5996344-Alexandrium_andersonii.AAC.1